MPSLSFTSVSGGFLHFPEFPVALHLKKALLASPEVGHLSCSLLNCHVTLTVTLVVVCLLLSLIKRWNLGIVRNLRNHVSITLQLEAKHVL